MRRVLAFVISLVALALLGQGAVAAASAQTTGTYDVTLGVSKSTAFVNDPVKFKGRVHTASGRDAYGTVIIQRRLASGGTWANWRTDKLNRYGVFCKWASIGAKGTWEFRAKMPGNGANATGYSPVRAVKVYGPTTTEARVIDLVNKERVKRSLRPVRVRWHLTRAARYHARDMARRNRLTHYSWNGYSVGKRLQYFGYKRSGCRYWTVGENIARGKAGTLYATPEAIVASWMRSYGHRKVMLRSVYRDVGVGVRKSANGYYYYTLDMGRRVR
jgi:uncharacterized protein YkwD